MLELKIVSKTYKRADGTAVTGLRDVSLRVEAGEFVAVQGPSGCGKSTLLLTCGALLGPDQGTVLLKDTDLYAQSRDARARFCAENIGFVFQRFHLIPYLSLRDNVLAPSLARERAEASTRAAALLDQFGLTPRAVHVPAELSTGERQRAALARALFHEPALILADEPTGNLDPDAGAVVLDALATFAGEGGMVLMVTHSQAAAARAGRCLHMVEGSLSRA